MQRLTLGGRYDLLRGDGLTKLVEDIKSRMAPGLSEAVEQEARARGIQIEVSDGGAG